MVAARTAALLGVLSGDAYVALVAAAAGEAAGDETNALADAVRTAYAAADADDRFAAMSGLWQAGDTPDDRYAAMVLTSRAAAALAPRHRCRQRSGLAARVDAGGRAMRIMPAPGCLRWPRVATPGVVMAVGLPRALNGIDAGSVGSFAGDDDSAGNVRAKFLVAGLAGLGRLTGSELQSAASDLDMALGKQTRWTRAIDDAAARGEQGMVALLVATGMQSRDWAELPPYHLYRMVRALREVGLASEARMPRRRSAGARLTRSRRHARRRCNGAVDRFTAKC